MSQAIVKHNDGGHWYRADGTPCHTIIGANGKERSFTLRDAKKTGDVYPSVTTILKTLNKPSLTRWLVENAIVAAVTTKQRDGEDIVEFAKRIAEEAGQVAGQAADFGTRFHAMMQHIAEGYADLILDDDIRPYFAVAEEWFRENVKQVISSERVIIGDGYAGTADLFALTHDGKKVLFDFKTKTFSKDKDGNWKPAQAYDEHVYQLAAYADVLGADAIANVFVNNAEPLPFTTIYHDDEKRSHGLTVFKQVRDLWQTLNSYKPIAQ